MTPMAPRKNLNDGSGRTALPGLLAFVMGSQRLGKTICSAPRHGKVAVLRRRQQSVTFFAVAQRHDETK